MAEEYTPTTEHVALRYGLGCAGTDADHSASEYRPAFDRWLAAHDAQVKAEALRPVLAILSGYERALDEDGDRVQFGETELRRLYGNLRRAAETEATR